MALSQLPGELSLLSLCAILHHFDRELLRSLGQGGEEALTALFGDERVLPLPELPGMFQLHEELQAVTLARLRAERPDDELALHERAFSYFLGHIQTAQTIEQRLDAEQRCFYHLDALRIPLIERREWGRIRQYVAAARDTHPQRPHHLHLLSLYEGMDAIRTQRYEAGEAILTALLAESEVASEIRMRALNLLAQSHWFQTRYDRALEFYQQARTIASTIGNRTFQAHALLNMSMVYHEIGYYARALELSEQSLHEYSALGDAHHQAHACYEVAKNAMQLGRWHDAQQHFRTSGMLYEQLGVPAQRANLYCLNAMFYHALGNDRESEAWYLRSLEIGRSTEYGDPDVMMDAWLLLGLLYQTQENWSQALEAYEQAAALARSLHNMHSLALAFFRRGDIYKAQGMPGAAIDAYHAAIDLIETLRGNIAVEDVKLGLLGVSQEIYEAMVLLLLEQGRHADAYHFVQRARSRAFLDMLARKSPELYASFDQPVVTLAEIQAQLPADALLIEYYTTGVLPAGEHLIHQLKETNIRLFRHLVLAPRIVIFALTPDGFHVREAQLDPNLFRPHPNEIQPGRPWLHERKLRALYDRLIGPVQDLLAGRRQVFLIPHGPLHHVPFLALRGPDGRYFLDHGGPVIALAPSATVLVRNCLARPQVAAGAFLALGYDDESIPLHHAESEARAAARIMGGEAWTGPTPKSESLMAISMELRGLHVAGHAVFRPYDPLGSYLSLGMGDRLNAHTLMRELNLRASLVSLSACTSGLTQVARGDEMLGLLRAWLYAGATTVVCALWDAADIVARLMMERFYQALSAGASPGVAFRDAVVSVRQTTGRSLAETFARWRQEDEESARPGVLPEISPDQYDSYPYADALVWAPFMLIGRA